MQTFDLVPQLGEAEFSSAITKITQINLNVIKSHHKNVFEDALRFLVKK